MIKVELCSSRRFLILVDFLLLRIIFLQSLFDVVIVPIAWCSPILFQETAPLIWSGAFVWNGLIPLRRIISTICIERIQSPT